MRITFRLKSILLLILITISFIVNGQGTIKKFDYINLKLAYNYGRTQEIDIGLSSTKNTDASIFQDQFYYGPFLRVGYNWGKSNLFITKIGYEYSGFLMLFLGRVNLNNYTDFKENQITIKPEIGLTAIGLLTVTYGYNFSLTKNDPFGLNGHYIGVDIHLKIKKLK